jgi:hypothetical protein
MPQTTYNLDPVAALAGQAVDLHRKCGKYQAAEEIPPGRFVVLNSDGKLELPQDTSLGKVVGVSLYRSAKEPGAWAVDDYVPVLRSGTVWCESSASSIEDLASANVRHSSTISTHRGKVTDAATSAGAGVEISDPGPVLFYGSGPSGLALVELSFPGIDSDDDTRLDALEAVQIYSKTVTIPYDLAAFAAESDDGDAVNVNVGTALPAGAMLLAAKYEITEVFAGAGVTTLTMIVGFSGDTNGVIEAVDVFGDATGEYKGTPGTAMLGPAGEKQLIANFDPDSSAALDELTAGEIVITVLYTVA